MKAPRSYEVMCTNQLSSKIQGDKDEQFTRTLPCFEQIAANARLFSLSCLPASLSGSKRAAMLYCCSFCVLEASNAVSKARHLD
jgi:hypothetical protein